MQKKIVASCVAGIGMLAVAGLSFAQGVPKSSERSGAGVESKASPKRALGEVTSIDAKAGKLIVKAGSQELNLNVQGSTAKKSLESIKVGDKVNVTYRDQGTMLVADSVSKATSSSEGAASPTKRN
jgi:Cu/Ag efflux protein CusF